jgi:hypothetical protein
LNVIDPFCPRVRARDALRLVDDFMHGHSPVDGMGEVSHVFRIAEFDAKLPNNTA